MNMRRRQPPDARRIASWMTEISVRLARPGDQADLHRIATLDERPLPPPPHLIARSDGELAAALSLVTGEIVADPFRRTVELQQLLRVHAAGARVEPCSLAVLAPRVRGGQGRHGAQPDAETGDLRAA